VSLWGQVKQRRITQIVIAYLAGGWMVLAVVDQVVDREVLPPLVYEVALTIYLFGIAAALVIGWYHGEKGEQKAPPAEIAALVMIGVACIGASTQVVRRSLAESVSVATLADAGVDLKRVAVLYFDDLSPDSDLAPVADGITEALIDELSQVRSLDVISKNGVLPYRHQDVRSDSVARVLGTGTIIEGSVDRRGRQLRLTTRLVDGLSGADIERSVVDIPEGQFLVARDSVAGSVSRLLRQRLGEEVQLRELRAGTSSSDAWALAQRAERLRTDAEDNFDAGGEAAVSVADYQQADSLLGLAERADPSWVQPVAARARAAYRLGWFAAVQGDLDVARREVDVGMGHANRALSMDPHNAVALEQRGTLESFAAAATASSREDMEDLLKRARADLEAAVQADPTLATAHDMLSFIAAGQGDNVQAIVSATRALEEDAYLRGAYRVYNRLFLAQYESERFDQARTWCENGRTRFPDNYQFIECQLWLMASPKTAATPDSAWAVAARLDSLTPEALRDFEREVGETVVAGVLRKASLADSADHVLARVDHSETIDAQQQLYVYEAAIRATTGEPKDLDGAMAALRRWAAATPGSTLGPTAELNWWWRDLRTRPDFQQFVDKGD
jgi:TolB-like protein